MSFRLLTYNVLAQAYIRPERYRGCRPEDLAQEARRARLLRRIASFDADLIALQEVEADLVEDLERSLGGAYRVLHAPKPTRPDGLAVLVRREHEVQRTQVVAYEAVDPGYPHLGLVVELEMLGHPLAVGCTHLRWQGREVDPSVHQGRLQFQELWSVLEGCDARARIVCGDLNATHGSPVLRSARDAGLSMGARSLRPWDTALINGNRRKLDYVLVDESQLRAVPHPLPSLSRHRPIPSEEEPSDHLPLCVELSWC